jgi:gamma-glutamylcyclotransferase (GGCT)/AIG2-like uncharacterized protein YtfP
MQQQVFQIFVYGSLRSGFHAPAFEYISRYFDLVSDARVKGYLYDMGEFPAALPTDDDAYLIGELYRIKHEEEFHWAIEQLDAYEGVHSEPEDEAIPYRRDLATVYTANENEIAWIYWFNEPIKDQPIIPSGDMLEYMRQQKKLG